MTISAHRIGDRPIIDQTMSDTLGDNINGPSLVARPDWAPGPGRYMLYFANHYGRHIRLAFADRLQGPWSIHEPGVLAVDMTPFAKTPPDLPQPDWAIEMEVDAYIPHVASPDVHINDEAKLFEMLFHGLAEDGIQKTVLARSSDGLNWRTEGPMTEQTYLRRFEVEGTHYALALCGQLLREQADSGYELGPRPLSKLTRHVAAKRRGNDLHILFTRYEDAPERILSCILDISGDWRDWRVRGEPKELLLPELSWEGANLPIVPSKPGATPFTNALRDPALFEEDGRLFMVYAGGGEAALGIAEITGL